MSHSRHPVRGLSVLKSFCFLSLLLIMFTGRSLGADCTLPLFAAPWHFSNGGTTVVTAVADFNNGGNLDIAATAHDASFVGIFIGNGTGNFVRQTVLSAGNFSVPVVASDFNNDGKEDLAVGSRDGTVWIYLGNGNGTFTSPVRYADGPGEAYEMVVADFNEDGKRDLAIAHYFGGLALMLGDGNGGFSLLNTYLAGFGPAKVSGADFNNDGHLDLITRNANALNTAVLLGNGAGDFSITIMSIRTDQGFAIGDFNSDGNIDFASGEGSDFIRVYYGDGHGGFPSSTSFADTSNQAPHAADFDGDGHLDIIGTGHPNPIASIIFGNGTGGFGPAMSFPVGNGPQGSSVADFNNDGKPDVVTPNYYGGDITVSINNGIGTQDTSPPIISSAPNISAYANTPGGANVSYQLIAFDNSGTTPTFDCSIPAGSLFPIGTTVVVCSAVDACGNHSSNTSFTVTVSCDPLAVSLPTDIQVYATGPSGAVVDYPPPQGSVIRTCSIPSGSTFAVGTTAVSCIVSDSCGVSLSRNFNVTVVDQPPVLSLPGNIVSGDACPLGKVVHYQATATDAASGNLPINCNPASGSNFRIGQTSVTCSATDAAGHTTSGTFNVSVLIGPVASFGSASTYEVGSIPGRIAVADFNKDGTPDMAVTSPDSSFVAIFLGTGNGNFGGPNYLSAGGFSVPVSTGDFNRDNNPDIAVGSSGGDVWIYLGDGSGGFNGPTQFADNGGEAYEMVVDDFNRDGKQDLAIAHQFTGLDILLGDGNGGFSAPVQYLEGAGPVQVRATDFNNDGKTDLVTSNAQAYNISILLGDGAGGFTVSTLDSIPGNNGVSPGDFNEDGNIDLVVKADDDASVSLLLGDGLGGFALAGNYQTDGNGIYNIKAADFNQDGNLDVAVMNVWSNTVSILLGDGHGTFGSAFILQVGNNPVDLVVADLNGDGKPDLATANYADYNVSVLLNSTESSGSSCDQTAPSTTASTSVAPNAAGWNNTNVSVTFNATDESGGSGVKDITYSASGAQNVPSTTAAGAAASVTITAEGETTLSFFARDNAGNIEATQTRTIKLDKHAPVITITTPTAGPYLLNQTVPVNYTCTDGGSGVASCTGTTAHGGNLDTGSIGAKTFSVSAVDNAGNTSPTTVNYTVGYGIVALFDQTKAHKSGSTVPVKIRLVDANGANVSSATTAVHAISVVQTGSQASTLVEDAGNSNPDFDFRYDAGLGGYIFNLQTTGYGTGTYRLNFNSAGGSVVYSVSFQVRQ